MCIITQIFSKLNVFRQYLNKDFKFFLSNQLDFLKIVFFQFSEYYSKSTMACDYSGVSRLFSSSYVSNLGTYMAYAQENSLLFCITITNCNIYVFQKHINWTQTYTNPFALENFSNVGEFWHLYVSRQLQ